MSDELFPNEVKAGVALGGTIGTAGAALIGAAAGAAIPPPFSAVAAPLGAAIGAMIGFFVSLGKKSPAEIAAAERAHAELTKKAQASTALLAFEANKLPELAWGSPASVAFMHLLQDQANRNPEWAPMITAYIQAIHDTKYNPPSADPGIKKMRTLMTTLAGMSPTFGEDPFAYLRPPLSELFGPALNAVGINISDPNVLKMMRGQYNSQYDFTEAKWAGITLDTSMNIYGGPTEADRQKAAKVARIFAGGGTAATPMYSAQAAPSGSSGTSPLWYAAGAAAILAGGYYLYKK